MSRLNHFSAVGPNIVLKAAERYGTPLYLYDEQVIADKCAALLSMPNAYGLTVRYAMKANSTKAILKIVHSHGLKIDASSMNEVRRAHLAGIPYGDMILTTQEAPAGQEARALREMILQGLKYNVCSLRQLHNIADFAAENNVRLAVRIHPGVGSGESFTRNTGDKYSCFGIHLSDLARATDYAENKGVVIDHAHVHIGSGADPAMWRSNIDLELAIIEKHLPRAETVNFGGGLKEARMPDETPADILALGRYAKEKIERFYEKANRKLHMEIEPGNFVVANAGFVVTSVTDKKKTGPDGLNFVVLDGGMELNARPLIYAARHPFYIISRAGELLFSEFGGKNSGGAGEAVPRGSREPEAAAPDAYAAVLVGKCCESGDSQCLTLEGLNEPREIREPETGDFAVIGGAGAYCSTMSPVNYNSHPQAPEILFTCARELKEIRGRQTLEQLVANEV